MTDTAQHITASDTVALWNRPTPLARDRARRLTAVEIAHAAFAVAESENLQAVGVKRIAGRLGVPVTRLQTYLHDRTDLLDLMVDVALGEIEPGIPGAADWQARVWRQAHAVRTTVQGHPWLAALLGLRPASGPNGLRFTEHAMQALDGLGLGIATIAHFAEAVLVYVCGSVRPEAVARGESRSPADLAALASYLQTRTGAGDLPMIARLLDQPSAMDSDDAFDRGLSYLIAGMATIIDFEQHDETSSPGQERAGGRHAANDGLELR